MTHQNQSSKRKPKSKTGPQNPARERIRQIDAKALRKLRHPSRSERLRTFLD